MIIKISTPVTWRLSEFASAGMCISVPIIRGGVATAPIDHICFIKIAIHIVVEGVPSSTLEYGRRLRSRVRITLIKISPNVVPPAHVAGLIRFTSMSTAACAGSSTPKFVTIPVLDVQLVSVRRGILSVLGDAIWRGLLEKNVIGHASAITPGCCDCAPKREMFVGHNTLGLRTAKVCPRIRFNIVS